MLLARVPAHRPAARQAVGTVLRELFVLALDWPRSALRARPGFADVILSHKGVNHLVIEVTPPSSLRDHPAPLTERLERLWQYATREKIPCLGITDGVTLYVADVEQGRLHSRLQVSLTAPIPPVALWWLSRSGIHRPRPVSHPAR